MGRYEKACGSSGFVPFGVCLRRFVSGDDHDGRTRDYDNGRSNDHYNCPNDHYDD